MTRREFIGGTAATVFVPRAFAAKPEEVRAVLLHMGKKGIDLFAEALKS